MLYGPYISVNTVITFIPCAPSQPVLSIKSLPLPFLPLRSPAMTDAAKKSCPFSGCFTKILEKPYQSIALGAVLALIAMGFYHSDSLSSVAYWGPFFTFLHVLSGITWIGLLYYFNLVQ